MKEYIFKTCVTMKEYNRSKWWIDSDIIRDIRTPAENIKAALNEYRRIVEDKYYIGVSENAIRNKSPMYIDTKSGETKQIGFVITGSTDFEKSNYSGWSKQYIDLWVEVLEITNPDFVEV